MESALKRAVKLLAFMGMLSLALAAPAALPGPEVSETRHANPQPMLFVPSPVNTFKTLSVMMADTFPTPTKVRRQLVVPSIPMPANLTSVSDVPTVAPDVTNSPAIPTALENFTSSQTPDRMGAMDAVSPPDEATASFDSAKISPFIMAFDKYLNRTFPGLPEPNRSMKIPTCASNALVALWKWRNDCDRSAYDHIKKRCWRRAPSPERCCVDPEGPGTMLDIKRHADTSCRQHWPIDSEEEWMCKNPGVIETPCTCVHKHCNICPPCTEWMSDHLYCVPTGECAPPPEYEEWRTWDETMDEDSDAYQPPILWGPEWRKQHPDDYI